MPTTREVVYGLYGAWRLLRTDSGGLAYFDRSVEGFWKSFFAAVLVAPGYAIQVLIDLAHAEPQSGVAHALVVHAIAYVLGWVAFPLAMHYLTQVIDRSTKYIVFIVAFNWAKVIQIAVILPPIVLGATGILPGGLAQLLIWAALFVVLAYKWYISRIALAVSGAAAAGIVVLDLVIDLIVLSAVHRMTM